MAYLWLFLVSVMCFSVRKWKKKGTFGGPAERWEYEVGEQMVPTSVETESLVVSSSNVRISKIRYILLFLLSDTGQGPLQGV